MAVLEVSWTRIIEYLDIVTKSASASDLERGLITAYEEILASHRNEILLQMQAQTIREESIQESMRDGFKQVRQVVLHAFRNANIGNPEERTYLFLARGMLCNIAEAIQLPELKQFGGDVG